MRIIKDYFSIGFDNLRIQLSVQQHAERNVISIRLKENMPLILHVIGHLTVCYYQLASLQVPFIIIITSAP